MEKKHILIALAAIMLVVGSVFTVRAFRERSMDSIFNSNLEALIGPEAFQKGKGECWTDYDFTVNALFLSCESCIYLYGVPTYSWMTGYCN